MTARAFALPQDEAFARLRLLRSPNIGPISYRQLLQRFGTATAALAALPDLAGRGGVPYRIAPEAAVDGEIETVRRCRARFVFHDSPNYPPLLAELDSAPPILTVRGEGTLFSRPAVAIVGARNASAGALKLARQFASALSAEGQVVVSGLARGIDAAAHRGALAGPGGTIAVIASGIDVSYPPEHAELQDQIAEQGLLVTEQPAGAEARGRNFPLRNRIIAGLAAGTVVVEAAPKSGSLITARYAGEAGRELMAIPGSPLDSRAAGCNQLIRDGAVLVQSADDVLELVRGFTGMPRSTFREPTAALWPEPEAVDEPCGEPADLAGFLGMAPVGVDELIRQSGLTPSAVQLTLLELEIAGRLVRHAGGRVSLSA